MDCRGRKAMGFEFSDSIKIEEQVAERWSIWAVSLRLS